MKKRKVVRVVLINGVATVNMGGSVQSSIDIEAQTKRNLPVSLDYHPGEGVSYLFTAKNTKKPVSGMIPWGVIAECHFDPSEDGTTK